MTKSKPKPNGPQPSKRENKSEEDKNNQDFVNKTFSNISNFSYEDSLKELELIVNKLQSNDFKVDELRKYYIEGNLYLKHCEKLLDNLEQDVLEINENRLKEVIDK